MKLSKLVLLALFLLSITISCEKEKTEEVKEKVKLYIIAEPGLYLTASPLVLQLSGTNIETQNNIKNTHIMEVEFNKGEVQTLNLKVVSGKIENEMSLAVSKVISLNEIGRIAYKTSRSEDISLTFVL
ncbi:MAG: hypothetical protein REI64_05570 [Pedobacter sp.]|uniref:hypothetical protein n=1 Tax=Pedobacter sp. TaxID=1411316 RepID=UPI002808A453|nr:hypothetical protein [Pedobacter sp.]MDQ8004249.1 hypothetical protein [Pedobacter sp.]